MRPRSSARAAALAALILAASGPGRALPGPGSQPPAAATGSLAPAHGFVVEAGRFGKVAVYQPSGPPQQVVLFLSGDGGWNQGVVDMADHLRSAGTLVAGVSVPQYFAHLNESKAECELFGPDLERLSQLVQQRAGVAHYHYPLLVGYSSGATLVYAALEQTPKGIFAGGLSLGFCPDLELGKPLCKGNALVAAKSTKHVGIDLVAAKEMNARWIVLHGDQDQVCDPVAVDRFVAGIRGAELVPLPKVGHGYGVPKNWLPQFQDAFQRLATTAPQNQPVRLAASVEDLPLVEVPAHSGSSDEFVVLVTGDGGYAGMDQDLAAGFAAHGMPTVALNSLKYFWQPREPAEVASDLDRVVRHYLRSWGKRKVILVGYSMGADVLPFALNRMATRYSVASAALIGIARNAVFEFHVTNWIGDPTGIPTAPELARLRGLPLACIYGADETGSACPGLPSDRYRLVELPGGHHFNGDSQAVVRAVLAEVAE